MGQHPFLETSSVICCPSSNKRLCVNNFPFTFIVISDETDLGYSKMQLFLKSDSVKSFNPSFGEIPDSASISNTAL